jgi:catechol 2,3-dioxygenase-like lactoylglutathione lyase family enzyme
MPVSLHHVVIDAHDLAALARFWARVLGWHRVHLDLSPDRGEQEAEIERILALGARRVDIGQTGAESWTVLADPEGNEFCVVRPKRTLIG